MLRLQWCFLVMRNPLFAGLVGFDVLGCGLVDVVGMMVVPREFGGCAGFAQLEVLCMARCNLVNIF